MKSRILFTIMMALFMGNPFPLHAAVSPTNPETAKAFIEDLGRRAIDSLTKPGIPQSQLESKFQALLEEGFDVPAIAQFVMGSNWHHLNSDQQKRFVPLFEKRLKKTYSTRFQQYQGVEFTVKTAFQQGDHIVVHTTIHKPGDRIVTPVDWIIKAGKIYDVKIEGVSMTITIRDEYKEQFKQGQAEQFLTSLGS